MIKRKMEALIFEKATKSVTLETVPIPQVVNDDDVQVQVKNCGVCGTDVHIFHGAISNVGERFIPGNCRLFFASWSTKFHIQLA